MAATQITKELVLNTALAALAAGVGGFAAAIAAVPAGTAITSGVIVAAAYAGVRFAAGYIAAVFNKPVPVDE